jgi:plasminogen activator inhibitor 1 RNA-binding protein
VRAEKKEKVFLEIDAHFDRPNRGGRGRGDRGGRGRGRDRGPRGRSGTNGTQPTVNVEDEKAFPSLS